MRCAASVRNVGGKNVHRKPYLDTGQMSKVHLVFDGLLSRDVPALIAIQDAEGRSVSVGQWRQRPDGYWELVILSGEPLMVVDGPGPSTCSLRYH
jgi:hypothetical protein